MKALWFDGKELKLREMPRPGPGKNEALIRVLYAGICNTDLEILQGYMKFTGVLGHEFVGLVESGPKKWLGKRVVGEINLGCGKCGYCLRGLTRHCPNRTVFGISGKNGSFAEYITLPVNNLHEVPDSVSDLEAVLVEPLAAALRILDQVEIKRGQKVFVLGDGKLGQLIVRALRTRTKNLVLIGKHHHKLALAAKLGIRTVLAHKLRAVCPEDKAEVVIEATGNPKGIEQAIELCRPQGKIVLKSTFHELPGINLSRIVVDEIKLVGSRCGDFQAALKMLKEKRISLMGLVSKVYELDNFSAAFKKAASPASLKVVVKCRK